MCLSQFPPDSLLASYRTRGSVGFAPASMLQRDGALRRYVSACADTLIPRDLLQDIDSCGSGADESEFHGAGRSWHWGS